MSRARTQPATPDLFTAGLLRDASPPQVSAPKVAAHRVSQRHVLPKDLANAVRHLTDTELDLLITAAVNEAKRRGRFPSGVKPNLSDETKRTPTDQRRVELQPGSLPRGRINAVRAAYKAGITPSRIARQFGISQLDVRKALMADSATKRGT
jgi:hypothetical protein